MNNIYELNESNQGELKEKHHVLVENTQKDTQTGKEIENKERNPRKRKFRTAE